MKQLGKKRLVLLIAGIAVAVIMLCAVLFIIREKANRKEDERFASEIRDHAEAVTTATTVYSELRRAIGDSDTEVAIFSIGKGGVKWEKDIAFLKTSLKEKFGDSLNGFTWNSMKYKGQRYTVYFMKTTEQGRWGPLLKAIGRWEDEE